MKRIYKIATISLLWFVGTQFLGATHTYAQDGGDVVHYIDPNIGTVAPLLNMNRPVVHLPNQLIRVFPTQHDYLDMQQTAFPMTTLNVITPQYVFGIKPSVGALLDTGWYRRLTYDHDFEEARPWYYSVLLTDDNIRVEFTAGSRTGIYRFTFPEGVDKNLHLSHYYEHGEYELVDDHAVAGTEYVEDPGHQQKGRVYLYGAFSGSPEMGTKDGDKNFGRYSVLGPIGDPTLMDGKRAWASYKADDGNVVEFRYAISFISVEQAERNFREEVASASFEDVRASGESEWAKTMGRIQVEGGTEAQRRSFYTSLYRTYVRMVDITEQGRYFSGFDGEVHADTRPFYTEDYTWGNHPAMHPLRCILDPQREADMLQSYVRMYEQGGWMPEYPKYFGDREGMFAFHSAVMFLDAYRKGIRDFDVERAFEGILKNAEQATMLPSRNGPRGALEDFYDAHGYYPALHPGEEETDPFAALKRGQRRSAVAVTLAHSYDDWALSEFAGELGKGEIAKKYAPRAKNYRNLWQEDIGMFMPKDAGGQWIPIDPKFDGGHAGNDYYNENNGWSYLWHVQHDVPGLTELMGGKDGLEAKLDQLFREPLGRSKYQFWAKFPDQTGLIGQFSMGNQVSYHVPYLFNFTDSPWKTQKYTRLILDTWFQDNIFGVPGDEDGGALSAFVVFTAMGFYPVTAGVPMYTITSPVFSKVTIALDNGRTFTVDARGASRTNKYIQSASLNGKRLDSLWFSHEDLMDGGTLELVMGPEIPNRK